ncbi:MAG: iron-containing alcohol dehydrogenase [Verrucomicrobiaceae bacterium]|nr:iron-containing alcohol dehydrogenase [Verrucomicrobiaceae bacterium]
MITLPSIITLTEAAQQLAGNVVVWCTASVVERLRALVPWPVQTEAPSLDGAGWLLVVGGGSLIDQAKVLRAQHPSVKLAALPTLWGSGAEASPIAVLNQDGKKLIRMGPEMLPDVIVSHLEFAKTLPAELIKHACGDAWSHALEGFLSPLGTDETRADLAGVMKRMLQQPIGYADAWFELSALACAGQSKASVGLVHGIAHTLEGVIGWGHAKLCSLFLLPVMSFNQTRSPKWPFLAEHGLDDAIVLNVLRLLFEPAAYVEALPELKEPWMKVLRDPCSRTNSALVRPADIEFFEVFQSSPVTP